MHLNAPPPRLSDHRPELAHLDHVLYKALAKEPEDRFDRCCEFASALSEQVCGVSSSGRRSKPAVIAATSLMLRNTMSGKTARRFSPRAKIAVAIVVMTLVAMGITWATSFFAWDDAAVAKAAPPQLHPTLAHDLTGVPGATLAVPALDGTYRLDYDRAKQTSNGVIGNDGAKTSWWAFRSSCTATGCAAAGTKLDNANHQVARTTGSGNTGVLHFVDGHWQGQPRQIQVQCRRAHRTLASTQDQMVVWSLTPKADGTLRGVQIQTVHSNDCGAQGATLRIPVVVSRVEDVPPSVAVADPPKVPATTVAPVPTSSTPVRGGFCNDIDKIGYDSSANEQVVCEANAWDKAPITTGVHPVGTSCGEPETPAFAMSMSDDGHLIECDPATKVWTRRHG
jgi:serine/threonine-protein kinase